MNLYMAIMKLYVVPRLAFPAGTHVSLSPPTRHSQVRPQRKCSPAAASNDSRAWVFSPNRKKATRSVLVDHESASDVGLSLHDSLSAMEDFLSDLESRRGKGRLQKSSPTAPTNLRGSSHLTASQATPFDSSPFLQCLDSIWPCKSRIGVSTALLVRNPVFRLRTTGENVPLILLMNTYGCVDKYIMGSIKVISARIVWKPVESLLKSMKPKIQN